MIPLAYEQNKSHKKQKVCYVYKKEFNTDKNDRNAFNNCHYTKIYGRTANNIGNLRYKISKQIPAVFQNGSTFEYYFIFKELAKDSEGQFEYLGEDSEKYITFSVPIKKEHDNGKTIACKLKFIDSFRFMTSSLSRIVDNVLKFFKTKIYKSCFEYILIEDNKLKYKCIDCTKNLKLHFDKGLIN